MGKRKSKEIKFPLKGVVESTAHSEHIKRSTPLAVNCFPVDPIARRARGGSRPGLIRSFLSDFEGEYVNMLACMNVALGDGFVCLEDSFTGTRLSNQWSEYSWLGPLPYVTDNFMAALDYSHNAGGAVFASVSDVDVAETYSVGIYIIATNKHNGSYYLYLGMDESSPDYLQDGIRISVDFAIDGSGDKTISLDWYRNGTSQGSTILTNVPDDAPISGWLMANMTGEHIDVYWNYELVGGRDVGATIGTRAGFGMYCTEPNGGTVLVGSFVYQYFSSTGERGSRSLLVSSSGGKIYREHLSGQFDEIPPPADGVNVFWENQLRSAQSGQELFIADFGDIPFSGECTLNGSSLTDSEVDEWELPGMYPANYVAVVTNGQGSVNEGTYPILSWSNSSGVTLDGDAGTGTATYTIERCPKVYRPIHNDLIPLKASAGFVPSDCPCVARFLDRIVLAGGASAPHVWYMSRVGNPYDWDYSQTDAERAVAGTSSPAGVPGEPITALVPHFDDYMIIASENQLWRLRGDPAYGGVLNNVSYTIGIIGRFAWTLGVDNRLFFLSQAGLCVLDSQGQSSPQIISNAIPIDLVNRGSDGYVIQLQYDPFFGGIFIFMFNQHSDGSEHWWFDLKTGSFWKVWLPASFDPTISVLDNGYGLDESRVCLAGRDKKIRRFSYNSGKDEYIDITSNVQFGPFATSDNDLYAGILRVVLVEMGENQGATKMRFYGSDEWGSVFANKKYEYDVKKTKLLCRPSLRSKAFGLELVANGRWAFEKAVVTTEQTGGMSNE